MKGRIPGFSYNPKKHVAHFSLYFPRPTARYVAKRRRTRNRAKRPSGCGRPSATRSAVSRPSPKPAAQPKAMTFRTFVTEYLQKICARRAEKTLAIYRTIATTSLIPYFGEKPLDSIRSCDVEDFMASMLTECSPAYVNNCVRMAIAGSGSEVQVADAREFFRSLAVFIAPLFAGGGMHIKVLEAMSLGTPIVATPLDAGGIDATHEHDLLLAEDAESFADAIVRLLRDRETGPPPRPQRAGDRRGALRSRHARARSAQLLRIAVSTARATRPHALP